MKNSKLSNSRAYSELTWNKTKEFTLPTILQRRGRKGGVVFQSKPNMFKGTGKTNASVIEGTQAQNLYKERYICSSSFDGVPNSSYSNFAIPFCFWCMVRRDSSLILKIEKSFDVFSEKGNSDSCICKRNEGHMFSDDKSSLPTGKPGSSWKKARKLLAK